MIYIRFFTGLIVTLILDGLWLGVITKTLYQKYIGHVMADKPNFIAATVFYLLFVSAVLFFVVYPAIRGEWTLLHIILVGGFLGLVLYGTYDLTSNAIIKNWPVTITIIDMLWGTFITATVSVAAVYVSKLF